MKNKQLAKDYLWRSQKRLLAIEVLYRESAWADVVRESQEVVELALKGLLMFCRIETPRTHDVSDVLEAEKSLLPQAIQKNLGKYQKISRQLRRDRELSFYGSEDLTPSSFYKKADATRAKESAEWVVKSLVEEMAALGESFE